MTTIIETQKLEKYFKVPRGWLHAVDGVSFSIEKGKTLGIVGESGCGKSTLGRTLIHLLNPTGGKIIFQGQDYTNPNKRQMEEIHRNMQMIFQDPYSSLNPRQTTSEIIAEPLIVHKVHKNKADLEKEVFKLMDIVGLARRLVNSYPHELDGGCRQRIGVARAIALNPKFIVCDEPVSALDVSIQAQILNLLQDLQEERNLTYLFITHNLSVVRHISHYILVMYLGQMVEKASDEDIFNHRWHPYTKALLDAVPLPVVENKGKRKQQLIRGELTSPINPDKRCRFAVRCPYAKDKCFVEEPALEEVMTEHFIACHYVKEINHL